MARPRNSDSPTEDWQPSEWTQNSDSQEDNDDESYDDDSAEPPYFGDAPEEVAEDCFRIGGINVDNIPQIKAHRDNEKLFNDIKKHELDVVLMQEVGVYWNKVPWEDTFQARLDE